MTTHDWFTTPQVGRPVETSAADAAPDVEAAAPVDAELRGTASRESDAFERFTTGNWYLNDGRTRRTAAVIALCEELEPKSWIRRLFRGRSS